MKSNLVDAALGRYPLDLLISGARLVNVFTREVYPAEIGICEGVIVSVEQPGQGSRKEAHRVLEARHVGFPSCRTPHGRGRGVSRSTKKLRGIPSVPAYHRVL